MKTNEIGKKLGISKQTIMFYEKEGLLKPSRDENGYRNYSEEDLQTLKVIKLLRSMEVGIDDIKLVLDGKLSFHECLHSKEEYIEEKAEEIENLKTTVHELKEKQIPIIPALNDIEIKPHKKSLGFQRGSEKVSLGRRLTQKNLQRQTLRNMFYVVLLTGASLMGYRKVYGHPASMTIMLIIFMFFFILSMFCYTTNATSGYYMHIMSEYFIELDEIGLTVYQPKTIREYYKNIFTILFRNEYKYEYYYLYEDITKITITAQRRKAAITLPPYQLSGYTIDYTFEFNDGRQVYIVNPMVLDDDSKYFALIIKEKCNNIIDKENILDSLIEGKHIDEHMKEILSDKYKKH